MVGGGGGGGGGSNMRATDWGVGRVMVGAERFL